MCISFIEIYISFGKKKYLCNISSNRNMFLGGHPSVFNSTSTNAIFQKN